MSKNGSRIHYSSMNTIERIEAILRAVAVIASEFGPLFIHSEQGQTMLKTGVTAVQVLANVAPAVLPAAAAPASA